MNLVFCELFILNDTESIFYFSDLNFCWISEFLSAIKSSK